jgi:hypothetical protein
MSTQESFWVKQCFACQVELKSKKIPRNFFNDSSYSEIGEEAFGTIGRRLAQFSTKNDLTCHLPYIGIYVTLVGVGIIFLVLLGILMNGIYPRVSHGLWTLAIGIVLLSPIAMSLRSYGEIKIIR